MNNFSGPDKLLINFQAVFPDRLIHRAVMKIAGEKIAGIESMDELTAKFSAYESKSEVHDFAGDIVMPGLIDLHVHGCGGSDVMDPGPRALPEMARALLRQGTTAFLATTMTAAPAQLQKVILGGDFFDQADCLSEFLGYHMEGPCIADQFKGAQLLAKYPNLSEIDGAKVKILTLAPELPAAKAFIEWAKNAGCIISVGHSGASYDAMLQAIDDGVFHVTHAFNAMPSIHHRAPGLLVAALLDPRVTIELIADGVHIHPAVLELALRLKSPERIILVSDGTRAVGLPDGDYELGGQIVKLHAGKMTLRDGTIAGSARSLLDGVRYMVKDVGRPLYQAVSMASFNPAKLMRIEDRLGSLQTQKEATFLRLTPKLDLKEVWVKGRRIQENDKS